MTDDIAPLLNDDDSLISAHSEFGNEIPTYDDFFGPLWVFQNSCSIVGIVRAQDWHSAYEIVEDEILKPIEKSEVLEAYGYSVLPRDGTYDVKHEDMGLIGVYLTEEKAEQACRDHMEVHSDDVLLQERYSYQSNATGTGIVQHDLNGESLDPLTPEFIKEHGLVIECADADDAHYCLCRPGICRLEDVTQTELDELVICQCLQQATNVNNGGRSEQINFLNMMGWTDLDILNHVNNALTTEADEQLDTD